MVKVLDFGLAKAMDAGGRGSAPDLGESPTLTSPAMTPIGVILGTAAYMAPEQARGSAVDKRADIWAFGCLLFEMPTAASRLLCNGAAHGTRLPFAACPGSRNVLINSPSPQSVTPEKRLYHSPSGTSGSASSHVASTSSCVAGIFRL